MVFYLPQLLSPKSIISCITFFHFSGTNANAITSPALIIFQFSQTQPGSLIISVLLFASVVFSVSFQIMDTACSAFAAFMFLKVSTFCALIILIIYEQI